MSGANRDLPDGQINDSKSATPPSSPFRKNISLRRLVETDLLIRHPVPIRGAFRDRHGRGLGCGGRRRRF
jgi:hypothetical protein